MASEYLTLGRGKVRFAPFLPNTKTTNGWDRFGNCPAFNLNVSVEELTHQDSQGGLKEEDESVITARMVGGSITCDNLDPRNLGRWFLGSNETVTQASVATATENFAAVRQGALYQVGVSASVLGGLRNVTITSITDDVPNAAFVAGTDYTVDVANGTFEIVEGGAIADGTNLIVTYGAAATTYANVISGQSEIEGSILFTSDNPVGRNYVYKLPYVKLRPEGDLALVGDDWIQFSFQIKALRLGTQPIVLRGDTPLVI